MKLLNVICLFWILILHSILQANANNNTSNETHTPLANVTGDCDFENDKFILKNVGKSGKFEIISKSNQALESMKVNSACFPQKKCIV